MFRGKGIFPVGSGRVWARGVLRGARGGRHRGWMFGVLFPVNVKSDHRRNETEDRFEVKPV